MKQNQMCNSEVCRFCGVLGTAMASGLLLDGVCWLCMAMGRSRRSPRKGVFASRKESLASWYLENKDVVREKQRMYRLKNPEARKKSDANRRARKAGSFGSHSASDIKKIISAQKNKCAICLKKLKHYHVDHIIPLSLGGRNDKSNLQITCPTCNTKKGAQDPYEFAKQMGKLL